MLQTSRITLCSRCNAEFRLNSPHFPYTWSDIRANYFPSSVSETSQIYGSLDDATHELERYEQEIENVRGTLRQLEEERERLVKMMEGTRGLLSPVRRLPSELLLSVFFFLLEPEGYSLAISKFGDVIYSPTFNISHTCTFWRRIVYSSPHLWNSISVDVVGIDTKRRLNLVNTYLENSQASPLIIQITDDSFSPEDDLYFNTIGNTGLDVFKALVRHSERWVKVDLRFRQDIFRMLEAGSFQLPRLEELSMQSIQLTTSIRAACATTPTLRVLKVDGFTYYGIAFPYHTLQDLVVGEIKSCQLFIRMLTLCNTLKTLQVNRFWATRNHGTLSSASPSLPINCTFLERLSLTFVHWERLSIFFASISLPSLTEIEMKLSYEFDRSPWPSEDFIEMLKQSRCSLRRIKLDLCPLSDTYLLELFRLSPELEEFVFEEVTWMTCFTPRLLFNLTLSSSEEPNPLVLLPKLTRFSIHRMKTWDQWDILQIGAAMVESRRDEVLLERDQCTRLEEVSLSFYPEVPSSTLKTLFGESLENETI